MARLNDQQWLLLFRDREDGYTYPRLVKKYGVSKQAIINKTKLRSATDVVAVATAILNDQDPPAPLPEMTTKEMNALMNADNIDHTSRTTLNLQLSVRAKIVTELLSMQEKAMQNSKALIGFMWQVISQEKISASDFEKYTKLQDNIVNQIERLSKLHGMGFAPSTQINQQFNMGNGKTNGRKFEDDEFTGNEEIEIIFCTSKEQAEILKAQEND